MGPAGCKNILQVHPTRRCNLRCLHCYSDSGPEVSESLGADVLCTAVKGAAGLGYGVMGVSGGEPLMYGELAELLDCAHGAGMMTTVTSNGMLLDARRLDVLRGRADLLAISLDGVPESHNEMRASDKAFPMMESRLAGLRDSGIPFGFIFTLTLHNIHELEWVAEFAAAQGAALLQIHPLESAGRATLTLEGSLPDETEELAAILEAERIRELYEGKMVVQLDLAPRETIRMLPERVFADERAPEDAACGVKLGVGRFADLISPLVIEASGEVSPLLYGFARPYTLGNLHDASIDALAERWRQEKYESFRAMCRRVYERIVADEERTIVNWYEEVSAEARRGGVAIAK